MTFEPYATYMLWLESMARHLLAFHLVVARINHNALILSVTAGVGHLDWQRPRHTRDRLLNG